MLISSSCPQPQLGLPLVLASVVVYINSIPSESCHDLRPKGPRLQAEYRTCHSIFLLLSADLKDAIPPDSLGLILLNEANSTIRSA